MNAALTERLVYVARAARDAGHGKRGAVYDAACAELGMSRATLLRRLKEVSVTDKRKKRADAGRSALTQYTTLPVLNLACPAPLCCAG
ncbi:hypothetical protein BFD27_26260 [Escherichia coli]|uniref:hypothetical protein n=1 Tax=Escherichia coli TaxID=562 RepID=UPI000F495BA2|nr:hypothetical protein [Escherichia coli]ROJ19378.1 hypothetical protein BFD27_26260 [Escherichia coli]